MLRHDLNMPEREREQLDRDLAEMLKRVNGKDLTRRELVKRGAAIGVSGYGLVAVLNSVSGRNFTQARALASLMQDDASAGVRGGTLKVAEIGEPPTLDEHQTTAEITATIGYCMYETLFAYDADYQPVPFLVDTFTLSDDGMTYTFALRRGVPFHNGEMMTAADVVASLERWGRISGVGKRVFEATDSLTATDDATVTWVLTKPYGTLLVALANNTQAAVIYPKSVIDAGTDEPNEAGIGTGPYKLAEWRPDAYIRFERFEDYAAIEGGAVGYGGTKYAWADVIEFTPVPDPSARVAGMQAGDYHYANAITNDNYDLLKDASNLVVTVNVPTEWPVIFLNWQSPVFQGNLAMRQAVQAALDHTALMQSAYGSEDFWRLDPGLMMQQTSWWTDAGKEYYNLNDPDLAKSKLEEAGYDGTPLRFMASQEYAYMYATGAPATQQLEAAGFTIDLQSPDWATVVERRAKPEEWEMFVTGHGFVPDPSQISYVGQMNIYPGWWDDPDSLAKADELLALSEFDDRYAVWQEVQTNAYTQIPAIKTGDGATISVVSSDVGGWDAQKERGVKYWNLWINQ